MNKTKITPDEMVKLGFTVHSSLIQDSYGMVLIDESGECPFTKKDYTSYRAISLTLCNDKGLGEYYLFIREGETPERHEDTVTTITTNMLYVEDLAEFVRICKL